MMNLTLTLWQSVELSVDLTPLLHLLPLLSQWFEQRSAQQKTQGYCDTRN
jgi:hypothetical protein